MLCLLSIASCGRTIVLSSDATTQCKTECVSVSQSFVKEHAELFEEVIRLRDALAMCEGRK